MKRILMAGIAGVFAVATHAQAPAPSEWDAALKAEQHYCMDDVCLGMTVKEVSNLPGTHFTLLEGNKWGRNCEGSWADWDHGELIAKGGTKYGIGFRDFPGEASQEDRYRVQSISLTMPFEKQELQLLSATLADRYQMTNEPGKGLDSDDQEYNFEGQGFRVRLNAMFYPKPHTSLLVLGAFSEIYPQWMKSQPKCFKPTKPLPKL